MNQITIDITQYDKKDNHQLQYYLNKVSFDNPLPTLKLLAANPADFLESREPYCKIILTQNQNNSFIPYLEKDNYHSKEFGAVKTATHILAFSFGENPAVNAELASIVHESLNVNPNLIATVQWEIADIIKEREPALSGKIHSVNMDKGQTYINTDQVIDKFVNGGKNKTSHISVLVIAQAWHAPRCIERCTDKGLNVTAGRFSECFSPTDPQPWVQNAYSWVLKEGTKNM